MRLSHKFSEHLLREASQRPLRAWEAAWLRRHLSGCAPCSALAAELAHFIQARVRLAPSTADRISQRLHAALADEGMSSRFEMGPGWAAALAGAGVAGALALMLLSGLFSPGAGSGRSMANLSLPQGPAQGLTDPLQPLSQQPVPVALSRTPDELAAEAPAPLSGPKALPAPALAAIPTLTAALAPVSATASASLAARPAPTSSPAPSKALARSLTRSAGGRLATGLGTLNPVSALPGMSAPTPSAALPQATILPSSPESSLAAPSTATGTASR